MALTAELECPSGAVVKIEALKGSSLDKFVEFLSERNRKNRTEAGYLYLITKEAVVEVLNVGPYDSHTLVLGPSGLVNPSGLLLGDVTYILAHTRFITVGHELAFEHECPKCKHSNHPVASLHNLTGQVYSETALEAFSKGQPHTCMIDDRQVGLTPATGKTLEYQAKVQKDNASKGFSLSQASMIARVDGLEFPESRADIADWVADLDFVALSDLEEATEALDGGIELNMKVTCASCAHESEASVSLVRPLEAKEAARPANRAYLRSLKESATSPSFSTSQLKKKPGVVSSDAPESP